MTWRTRTQQNQIQNIDVANVLGRDRKDNESEKRLVKSCPKREAPKPRREKSKPPRILRRDVKACLKPGEFGEEQPERSWERELETLDDEH